MNDNNDKYVYIFKQAEACERTGFDILIPDYIVFNPIASGSPLGQSTVASRKPRRSKVNNRLCWQLDAKSSWVGVSTVQLKGLAFRSSKSLDDTAKDGQLGRVLSPR